MKVDFEPREHSIQADLGLLKEARDFAERAAADFGLDGSACYDVKLAMSEAVTNAIQHGSSSPQDPIRILVLAEGPSLVFEVLDTGRFVPRVKRRGGELSESGRGLEFMRVLMDEVDLRPGDGGTLMRFAKRLPSSRPSASPSCRARRGRRPCTGIRRCPRASRTVADSVSPAGNAGVPPSTRPSFSTLMLWASVPLLSSVRRTRAGAAAARSSMGRTSTPSRSRGRCRPPARSRCRPAGRSRRSPRRAARRPRG